MEMVPLCRCSIRRKVRHLCPSNIALLWVVWAVCPIGRWCNTGCNQLRPCACLATNRNHKGRSIACLARNAQGNHVCPPAVMHRPRVGVRPPSAQASWPLPGVGPAVHVAACLIYLPQLPKAVGLIDIRGQPARPEVVNERPVLGHVSAAPHMVIAPLQALQNHGPSCSLVPPD